MTSLDADLSYLPETLHRGKRTQRVGLQEKGKWKRNHILMQLKACHAPETADSLNIALPLQHSIFYQ